MKTPMNIYNLTFVESSTKARWLSLGVLPFVEDPDHSVSAARATSATLVHPGKAFLGVGFNVHRNMARKNILCTNYKNIVE